MKSPNPAQPSEYSRRSMDIPGMPPRRRMADDEPAASSSPAPAATASAPAGNREGADRQLIVGRDISLTGEITACDHLVVEGRIEATLRDCRIIQVADGGTFKGSAEIEEAEIGGRFEGDLSVRGKLKVHGTGNISGTIRYGQLEVEVGGRLTGEIAPLDDDRGDSPAAESPTVVARAPFAPAPPAASSAPEPEAASDGGQE